MFKTDEEMQKAVDNALIDTDVFRLDPVDVIGMARKLGFAVENFSLNDLPREIIAFMLMDNLDEKIKEHCHAERLIALRKDYSVEQKRFAVACELGHYSLHEDCFGETHPVFVSPPQDGNYVENWKNEEARKFADFLLMDERTFREGFADLKQDPENREIDIIRKLAKVFAVPQKAVERRIKELGL